MRSAVSPLAELAADVLPAAAGGLSGGGACITSTDKSHETCSKGNKTCWKGKLSYPSNIGKINKPLTHSILQKQNMFKGRKNLPFQHKTRPFEHITLTSNPSPPEKKTAPLPTTPHKESAKHIATGYDHNFYNTLIFNKLNTLCVALCLLRTAAGIYASQLLQLNAFMPSSSQRARHKLYGCCGMFKRFG